MYPTLVRIGSFEITTFGVMVAVAALVGVRMFGRELSRSGLPATGVDAALAGVFGGLAGAKLLWSIEHAGEAPFLSLLLSRGGMSWFGGFLGGVGTAIVMMRARGLPLLATIAAATPALAVGHALGRIGCFLVGDDYGRPSNLPWAVAFPKGIPPVTVPVHPTQLYEAAALALVAWALMRWRRAGVSDHVVLGRYLVMAGAVRFGIEFIRVNTRLVGPLTLAHLVSLGLCLVGVAVITTDVGQGTVRRSRRGRGHGRKG
ncbi:MAG: prolipoprotein diacylglyceryl transferase [Vicinamibacterales bacterium]